MKPAFGGINALPALTQAGKPLPAGECIKFYNALLRRGLVPALCCLKTLHGFPLYTRFAARKLVENPGLVATLARRIALRAVRSLSLWIVT
jgi:hypothetical protein